MASRVLTVREWLIALAPAVGMRADLLAERIDLGALNAALEAPGASWQGAPLHADLDSQAAVLVQRMLSRPPLEAFARPLAFLTLIEFMEINGYALDVTDAERSAFMSPGARATASGDRLVEWIRKRRRRRSSSAVPATGSTAAEYPLIFIAVPVCRVGQDIAADAPRKLGSWVDTAIGYHRPEGVTWRYSTDAPGLSHHVVVGEDEQLALATDEADRLLETALQREPDDTLRRSLQARLRAASALVVVGVGGGSFGSGFELGRIARSAPVLYLRPEGYPLSRWLSANVDHAHLTVAELSADVGEDEVRDVVNNWLTASRPAIERQWRRRQMRLIRSGPLAARFAHTWGEFPDLARVAAFVTTGLPVDVFHGLLTPEGVADARKEELEAMCDALGLDLATVIGNGRPPTLVRRQRRALAQFADEYGLTRSQERDLEYEAEQRLAVGLLRYALQSVEDWARFASDLHRARLG